VVVHDFLVAAEVCFGSLPPMKSIARCSYMDPPCYPDKTTMVANEKKDVPRTCVEESTAALPGLTLLVAALRPQLADLSCDAAGTGAEILVTLILESERKLL